MRKLLCAAFLLIQAFQPTPRSAPVLLEKASASAERTGRARLEEQFGKLPLYFVENRGQLDPRVAYSVQGKGTAIYFTKQGITFSETRTEERKPSSGRLSRASFGKEPFAERAPNRRWNVKLDFLDANPDVEVLGTERTGAVVSYFKGSREEWKTGLPTYASVRYRELWPGIDLVYSGTVNRLKYQFVVEPGADPGRIRLAYRGASEVKLGEEGALQVETPLGGFSDDRPYSYQEIGGRQVEVGTEYALSSAPSPGHSYGFRLSTYDKSRPLVIDPAVLVYAGFIGGSAGDTGLGVAVDSSGNAYVTGTTSSTEATFPDAVGPDLISNGVPDAFVAKVNAAGTGLVYAGYIGGSSTDEGRGIAVDASGNAYVVGQTFSSATTFPDTVGPDLIANGGRDAFVAKVNAAGTSLVYAGYIGGSAFEEGLGIAVDPSGNAYVAGTTSSTEMTFPVTVGPDLIYNGGQDVFVAKVNAAGTGLAYAGYIGGSGLDAPNAGVGIAVDASGNAYVTGATVSTEATFPVTVGPDLMFNGSQDVFVAKVNAAGTGLAYAGYIGGSGFDEGFAIAVDGSGNAYVTGGTSSTAATFPATVGPDLTLNDGGDAFVVKVNAAGTGFVYGGYIGGSGGDIGFGIAVDASGNAYITGVTTSTEATFPVAVGPDLTYNMNGDAFVAKVNAAGTGLVYAGYIGGSASDEGHGIAVGTSGTAYVAGNTSSDEATFPETAGPDLSYNLNGDAFVAKVSEGAAHFFTVAPCRVADTRDPIGPWGGPALSAATQRIFTFVGRCNIPPTARAVALSFAVTQPTAPGDLSFFPGGTPVPLVSAINYRAGQTRANNAIVALSGAGTLAVYCNQGSGTVHVILDVNGYFE